MHNQIQLDLIRQAVRNLVYPTGYTDFRLTNPESDLVVLNPKTSNSGNMDFISLNKEFLNNFREGGEFPTNLVFNSIGGGGIENVIVEVLVPRIGVLMGHELLVSMEGRDDTVGTCSLITDMKDLGIIHQERDVFDAKTRIPNLYEGFKDNLNLADTFSFAKAIEMSNTPARMPKGLEVAEYEKAAQVMGLYYTNDRSIMGLYTKEFIDSSTKLLDDLTRRLLPKNRLAETLVMVEILPGCIINMAVATYNAEKKSYMIDVITTPNHLQVPDSIRVPDEQLTCGYRSAEAYSNELIEQLDKFIDTIVEKALGDSEVKAPKEIDGVIHFPKGKMS